MQIVMGVDPGLHYTGVGVICAGDGQWQHLKHEVIALPNKYDVAEKLHFLAEQIAHIINEFSPQVLSLEKALSLIHI